jgi:hypothetical protein
MTGNFKIDGQDAFSLYRVYLTDGGYKDLLAYPSLKTPDYNDWAEEDGVEYDLDNPVLSSKELTLNFAFKGYDAKFGRFMQKLSDGAYHEFEFTEIGKNYSLRLVSQPSYLRMWFSCVFSLRFSDDFPLAGYEYVLPQNTAVSQQDYEIDGANFAAYGVSILRGSRSEVERSADVKKNLSQESKYRSGAIYDGGTVCYKTKDVKLNCVMIAQNLSQFWQNYNALLYDLIRPGERSFHSIISEADYACIYKSCTAQKVSVSGVIWFQFVLTLTFNNFRVAREDDFLLSAENWKLIEKEEGLKFIDLETE